MLLSALCALFYSEQKRAHKLLVVVGIPMSVARHSRDVVSLLADKSDISNATGPPH